MMSNDGQIIPPAGGYPPPPPPGSYAPPAESSKSKKGLLIGLATVLVLGAAGAGFWFFKPADAETLKLEPAASIGSNPFTDEPLADAPTDLATKTTTKLPSGSEATSAPATGTAPGLYGGTNVGTKCNSEAQIAFLKKNPAKAKAWVDALNADPNLRWDRGELKTADIGLYIAELTPVVLKQDTLVGNHGFVNGKPTKFNSVLQRGSSVLVDKYGVPRVRCYCGNPLVPPTHGKTTPKKKDKTPNKTSKPCPPQRPDSYEDPPKGCEPKKSKVKFTGEGWEGFDPKKTAETTGSDTAVKEFTVTIDGKNTTVPRGPQCEKGQQCPELEKAYKELGLDPATIVRVDPGPKPGTTTTDPTPTPTETTPTAVAKPEPSTAKGTITVVSSEPGGVYEGKQSTRFYFKLSGYTPNSYVTITCSDSRGSFDPITWNIDASGNGVRGSDTQYGWCESTDGFIKFSDHLGGSATGR